nr:hypothetical protein [Bradyrhizobium sp. CCBAU 45384]
MLSHRPGVSASPASGRGGANPQAILVQSICHCPAARGRYIAELPLARDSGAKNITSQMKTGTPSCEGIPAKNSLPAPRVTFSERSLDRQAFKFQVTQRGFGKDCNDVATAHGTLESVEFLCRDNNRSIFPVQRHALRSDAVGFSEDLAQVSLRILKAPSSGLGALLRRGTLCSHLLLSGRIDQI